MLINNIAQSPCLTTRKLPIRNGAILFDKPVDPKILGTYYKIATQVVEEFALQEGVPLPPLPVRMAGASLENQAKRLDLEDIWWFVHNKFNKNAPPYLFEQAISNTPTTQPILGVALLSPKELNSKQLVVAEQTILDRLTKEFSGITGQVMTMLEAVVTLNNNNTVKR